MPVALFLSPPSGPFSNNPSCLDDGCPSKTVASEQTSYFLATERQGKVQRRGKGNWLVSFPRRCKRHRAELGGMLEDRIMSLDEDKGWRVHSPAHN
jgi:hypothetical protein